MISGVPRAIMGLRATFFVNAVTFAVQFPTIRIERVQ